MRLSIHPLLYILLHICIHLSIIYLSVSCMYESIHPSSIYSSPYIHICIHRPSICSSPCMYPSLIHLFITMYPPIYPSIIQAPIYLIYTHPDPLPQSIYIHLSNHPSWMYPSIQLIDTNPSLHPAFLCPSTIYTSICASIYPSIYERMKAWRSLDAPPLSSVAQSNSHMLRFSL